MSLKNTYICFLNAHMVYEFGKAKAFKKVLNEAGEIFADGMPIVFSLRAIMGIRQDRVAGNDVIESLIGMAEEKELSIFFYGSDETTLGRIKTKTEKLGIRADFYSPAFRFIENFDFDFDAQRINNFNPDIVLVSLGCPKQEIWMNRMQKKIPTPMYGLGGAFLIYAGLQRRASLILRKLAMEWVFRLMLEPNRMWKRYFVTNSYFIKLFVFEFFKIKLQNINKKLTRFKNCR